MEFEDFCQQIENGIQVVFLFAIGRSGSVLLQSFIDDHPEVLMIPQIIDYYSYNEELAKCNNFVELINFFMSKMYAKNSFFSNGLGENIDETFDKKEQLFAQTLLKTIEKLKVVDRKTFILATHYAYAIVKNKDLNKIKTIIIHQHHTRPFIFFVVMNPSNFNQLFKNLFLNKSIMDLITSDFPDSKLIATVRNPYDLYLSYLSFEKKHNKPIMFEHFYNKLYVTLFCYFDTCASKNIKYFKFEDLHKNTFSEMKSLSEFIGITFNEILLKSTIDGKLWWGNNPEKIINGPQKDLDITKWKTLLDYQSKLICNYLFKEIIEKFGYETTKNKENDNDIYKPFKNEFESYLFCLFNEFYEYNKSCSFQHLIYFPEFYPILRNFLINYFVHGYNLQFPKTIAYNGLEFIFHYDYHQDFELGDKGYLIIFQDTFFNSLPLKKVQFLNAKADQIWVTNKYTKDIFLNSGISENKVKLVPVGIDTSIFSPSEEHRAQNMFKFLFIGDFSEELMIILKAFSEEFRNEPIKLIIKRIVKSLELYDDNNDLKHLNMAIPNEIKTRVELIPSKISKEMQNKLYNSANCVVYPYKLAHFQKNVLEAMACELPVIITNGAITQDICNSKNSFLLKCTYKESYLPFDAESNEKINICEPDYQHLRKLMRYVFENKDEAKKKGLNARKTILKDFSIQKNLKKVYKHLEELKGLPITRNSNH